MGRRMNFILRMKFRFFLVGLVVLLSLTLISLFMDFVVWLKNGAPLGFSTPKILSMDLRLQDEIAKLRDGQGSQKDLQFSVPILIDWNGFLPSRGNKTCFTRHTCYFTRDRSALIHPSTYGIVFQGESFSLNDVPVPRGPRHDWALYYSSDPALNPLLTYANVIALFNHSASISPHSDFPITLQHLESSSFIKEETHQVHFDVKDKLIENENLGLVGYFEWDCDSATNRDEFVKLLMPHIQVDSYGTCMKNKNQDLVENSEEHLKLMGKYKFILVLEKSECQDNIGLRLWQVLHVGAIPIYFGAPNVDHWMPNKKSVIKVTDHSTPKLLADHLRRINLNRDEYIGYLQHKPTYNKNYFTLITNREVNEFVPKKDYLSDFECFLCERVSKNEKVMKIGFKGYPYHTDHRQFRCPRPQSIVTRIGYQADKLETSVWLRKWTRAKFEAKALNEFSLLSPNFTYSEFEAEVIKMARREKIPMDQFLN